MWDKVKIYEVIEDFLSKNPNCQTKIKMHYRDAMKLQDRLVWICKEFLPQHFERLTLEFADPLPKDFEKVVNAELVLQGANVSVKGNTITFKEVEIKKDTINEDTVKAYFGTHARVVIPLVFASVCSPKELMPLVLNRTSDTSLTLDMRSYDDRVIEAELPESLKAIPEAENPKGLNLRIIIHGNLLDWNSINEDLREDKRHLKEVSWGVICFETAKEAKARRLEDEPKTMHVYLQEQKGDVTLDKEKSAFVFAHAKDLLNADFFNNHAGHTVTLQRSDRNTDALETILRKRGLELTDNQDGTLSFTVAFALPNLNCDRLPTIWLIEDDTNTNFSRLQNVYFTYVSEPGECPKEVREMFGDDYDNDNDLILNAVCYAGKDSLKQSRTIALEFGNWVPKEVGRWTSEALCVQNINVTANNGITVARDDDGTSALLEFNISNENVKAANAWFVCEYEVGEDDPKEKHRIAVHLFFAEEQPASIVFENLEYPLANDKADIETRGFTDERARILWNFFHDSLTSEMNAIPEPEENGEKTFSPERGSLWASYLRDGLLGVPNLVRTVHDYNFNNRGDRTPIKAIDLFYVNPYKEQDFVYFSERDIINLNGTGV